MDLANVGCSNESFSSASVTNDWMNWVTLQGNGKVVAEDIEGIGKEIGVSFPSGSSNMFSALARSKHLLQGSVLTLVEDRGGVAGGRE